MSAQKILDKNIHLYYYDLPDFLLKDSIKTASIDTEALGLSLARDRLCTIQIMFDEEPDIHIIHYPKPIYNSPNINKLLSNKDITKIFHYARFDVTIMYHYLGGLTENLICTRILSKIVRTYSDNHGLKELCKELLKIDLNKGMQASDWGAEILNKEQLAYAAQDVIHLKTLSQVLMNRAERENRLHAAKAAFSTIPGVAVLDSCNYDAINIINHH